jgi:exodeoxyribonuclease VII small subunit
MVKLSFEDAMKRLEEIADMLEKGTQTLDETIVLFEESNALVKFCEEKLDKAENKLHILTTDNNTFQLHEEIEK